MTTIQEIATALGATISPNHAHWIHPLEWRGVVLSVNHWHGTHYKIAVLNSDSISIGCARSRAASAIASDIKRKIYPLLPEYIAQRDAKAAKEQREAQEQAQHDADYMAHGLPVDSDSRWRFYTGEFSTYGNGYINNKGELHIQRMGGISKAKALRILDILQEKESD